MLRHGQRSRRWIASGVAKHGKGQLLVIAAALSLTLYVVCYPLWVGRYPPLTDLPFHAAQTSILRHYWDPAFHFHEQYTLHPVEVPYVSMYALGAVFALVMSIVSATKLMAACMLLMLPAGLAVFFWGMKKSPLWGLLGLGLVWGNLTHWGFLNYVGAIGLYAMAIGLTLRAVDVPSRKRSVALGLCITAIFFTHIYRLPFALLSVVGTALVMYPATRRFRPVVVPVLSGGLLLFAWSRVRPADDTAQPLTFDLHMARLDEVRQHLFATYTGEVGKVETAQVDSMLSAAGVAMIVALVLFAWQGRLRGRCARELWWGVGATLLPLGLAAAYLVTYLVLPMRIGVWWYVYPREITTTCFMLLGLAPDMPRQWWFRAAFVAGIGLFVGRFGLFTAQQFHEFDETTRDFDRIAEQIPAAPKLMYLVYDHSGTAKRNTPYIHLPAWIQATHGGWLSFHFVGFSYSPIRNRPNSDAVPPAVPERWEWTPQRFRVLQHGPWFDTFLIRSARDPGAQLAADPSIRLVAHEGRWWLYRRQPSP